MLKGFEGFVRATAIFRSTCCYRDTRLFVGP
jgi:hypothetical protein